MNEYSMMTQELQDLAALSMEHGQIPSGLYDRIMYCEVSVM